MERGACMEHERAALLGLVDAGDLASAIAARRIPARPRARRSRRGGRERRRCAAEIAARGRGEQREQIGLEQRENRLRLRIAEAAVELEHPRAVRGEHEPRVEQARRTAHRDARARRARARGPLRRARRPRRRRARHGAYAPIPPVFGPSSPSNARLKSCADTSATASRPSHSANSETSGPSRSSSTTTSPPASRASEAPRRPRLRCGRRRRPSPQRARPP